MGMFDTVYLDKKLLPLSKELKEKLPDKVDWQTKEFDNMLTELYISSDKRLMINRFEMEVVPIEERDCTDPDNILSLFGSMRRVDERLEDLNYHGKFQFGQLINNLHMEFEAKFTDGYLVSITCLNTKIHISKPNKGS